MKQGTDILEGNKIYLFTKIPSSKGLVGDQIYLGVELANSASQWEVRAFLPTAHMQGARKI